MRIHRSKPGWIHYDGDPVEAGTEIEIHIKEKGIKMLVNPFTDRNKRQPTAFQNAAAELLNQINDLRNGIMKDINNTGKQIQDFRKSIQEKLNL